MDSFAIFASDIVKRYGQSTAVDHLSLSVPKGTIHGLLGPDGAGKTSLLRSLAGAVRFQSGKITIMGYDLKSDAQRIKPLVGYMPQRFGLYEDMTVTENLSFFANMYGVTHQEREMRLPRLVSFTRLSGHEHKLGRQLSGGMKQKLALSTVLMHNPQVLLLDEPSTGVDPVSRGEFWQILGGLRAQGVTVLVSTPYMDEAAKCDTLTMISQGRCLIEGSPEEMQARFPYKILAVSTKNSFDAHRVLNKLPDTVAAVIHGNEVHVVVRDMSAESSIRRALEKCGLPLEAIAPVTPGLEDVFVYELTSRGLSGLQGNGLGQGEAADSAK